MSGRYPNNGSLSRHLSTLSRIHDIVLVSEKTDTFVHDLASMERALLVVLQLRHVQDLVAPRSTVGTS